jgi:hypothetical protein
VSADRCDDCGRYSSVLTEVVLIPPNHYSDGSTCILCARCLRLFDEGYTECHEEIADRDGTAQPCERRAFDLRIDPEFGQPYPVCRAHYREPFVSGGEQ